LGSPPAPASLVLAHGVGDPRLKLDVNWDPDALRAFLDLPGAEGRSQTLPVDPFLLEALEHFLARHDVDVAPSARGTMRALRAEHDEAVEAVRRSRARTGPALAVEPLLGGTLEPFQRAGVAYLLEARRAFLADEQGLGKTIQALATLEADVAFPAIVVCPASLKLNWARETATWLPHRSVEVVAGKTGTPRGADLTILNYEVVHAHAARLRRLDARALVLDESHYVKNPRAKRTQAVRQLASALPEDALRLALSGTPVVNRPEELVAQLRVIGRLQDFGSGAKFEQRFQGTGAEERIHWHLRRRCMVRRLKVDVLPQLPAKRQVAVPVALANEREYRLAERDVVAWLREQPLDLSEIDRQVAAALRAERLAQLNALRRLAGRGKIAGALGWIEDFLASGERLVVFASGRELQDAMLGRFPGAAHLLGRDSAAQREEAVRAFQEPDGHQLIICSTRVAGHGITLTRASNVAFLDLEWSPAVHDQAEDRCHRIGQHDAVTAWYLLAAGTIDETMLELIARKRGVIGAVTDGHRRGEEAVLDGVVRELRGGAARRHLRVAGCA
ncbi:MAG: DEAD/DEAH box helicase, partial [Solirubrobacterales bacterium]|nr:DEAD/DEAH box helicase [Solirubrobacterales bacterium]